MCVLAILEQSKRQLATSSSLLAVNMFNDYFYFYLLLLLLLLLFLLLLLLCIFFVFVFGYFFILVLVLHFSSFTKQITRLCDLPRRRCRQKFRQQQAMLLLLQSTEAAAEAEAELLYCVVVAS